MTSTAAPTAHPAGPAAAPEDRTEVAEALARLPRVVDLLAARAEEHDRDGTFPYQGVEAVHEAGLLTLTVGRRYGGPGATLAETCRALAELGRGDASVALLTAHTLLHHADQARTGAWPVAGYRRLLTESRRGPALVTTLDAEPGGPAPLPATVARREGDDWFLTGRKADCAGAEALAWMAVRARTEEPVPRVGTFLVRGDSPGVEIDPTADQLGLRASAGHEVVLDGARVAPEAVIRLGAPGSALPDDLARAWRDLALSAVFLGVGRAAQDWLVGFLRRRTPANLSEPLATLPRHRAALGELAASLIGAGELLHGLAAAVDRGETTAPARAGTVRLLVNRTVTGAVQQALTISGSPGLSRRHPLERFLRDALSAPAHFPPDEAVLEGLARTLLDGPARRG
ncbi:acyl-CoA dehydrogenase family protein [Kitasatospora camelliae]|uniref:Acyl-CoA dehydrogenase family protein n=1 Tax=Kitasatospora camelliae TaxID=3156397 RepID=A0AAU8JSE7_9ACTN